MKAIKVLSILTIIGSAWMILMGITGMSDSSLYLGISAWLIIGALWSLAFAIVGLVVSSSKSKK